MPRSDDRKKRGLKEALALVTEALDLLDAYDGPPEAAAHLSLAQEQLRGALRDMEKPDSK